MLFIKLIKKKIENLLLKFINLVYKKQINYKSSECQTDISGNKIDNLLKLENDITNINNNPEKYKWYL